MKSQIKPKITMLLGGFASKYSEASEFFIGIEVKMTSGKNTVKATAYHNGEAFEYTFLSKGTFEEMSALTEKICDDVMKYDSAVISYIERGQTTDIIADERGVRMQKRETAADIAVNTQQLRAKDYLINPQKAAPLMKVLGYMTADGKLKNDKLRKYNQTERFVELIADMFEGFEGKSLTITDCACGKSYLSFVLNYYLWEVKHIKAKFIGIDISENVIKESRRMAEELGYKNMEFICTDLREYDSEDTPDAVISLHACDTATDMALGYAIRNKAKRIICVPCCHKELLDKYKKDDLAPIIKHGIFRTRLNDVLTDGIRAAKLEAEGYNVSCVEYCSPLDTPKNLLIRAEKVSDGDAAAKRAYSELLRTLSVYPSVEIYSTAAVHTEYEDF